MAYNEVLANRVKVSLESRPGFEMKKMFGGVCFLLHGNMACGVLHDDLIVRVGPKEYEASLALPNTREFDITGRPMKGWVMVSGIGSETKERLEEWLNKGVNFALDLPPKKHLNARS